MTVSEYIMDFLVENGIDTMFLISGGGMMHLLDAAKRQQGLELYFNLNEQASAICAESYAQFTRNFGVCMVTTGPGATNAVTGCAGAWVDSTPVMYISGQVKTEQMGQDRGLRIYGAQEIAIVPCVQPITKYAVTVRKADEIRYHLEKALYLATHGRKGPVWIDVPLDIQGTSINPEALEGYEPEEVEEYCCSDDEIDGVIGLLNESDRPVILVGHGVVASKSQEAISELSNRIGVPTLATWRAKGIWGDEERLFMGSPGIPTTRYSNYVLQNADLVLIIGTRLNPAITAFNERHFAPHAKKIMVDIDSKEIEKLDIDFSMKIVSDAGIFINSLLEKVDKIIDKDRTCWINYCIDIKNKYPLSKEVQPYPNGNCVDGYLFAEKLSDRSTSDDVFVGSSSGRTCGISHMAYKLKKGQKFVTSMGLGSMGWCIPSAISCCIASKGKRTLVLEGDGSLQHNIQELQLIKTYGLPVKIFIYSNSGYASIFTMQRNNFNGRYAGCNEESGLQFPKLCDVANTYGLDYYYIRDNNQIDCILDEIMNNSNPCLCEINGNIEFDEIPKSMTIVNEDGTFSSSLLENLYPFVSEEEQCENMPDWRE